MFSTTMNTITKRLSAPSVPILAELLDGGWMAPLLARAAGLTSEEGGSVACSAEVLNHKAGQRCTLRYDLSYVQAASGRKVHASFVGKAYREHDLARRNYEWTGRLRETTLGPGTAVAIPAPLLLVPDIGLIISEYVRAPDLGQPLLSSDYEAPMRLAAGWLARLHSIPPLPGLNVKPPHHEVDKVEGWRQVVAPAVSSDAADKAGRVHESMRRMAERFAGERRTVIHRDFYHQNLLWDGRRLWVLDFDQLSIGDPAMDAGHFLAHVQYLAYRTTGRPDSLGKMEACFLSHYEQQSREDVRERLPWYKAYTFLKLAATEVTRQRTGWQRNVEALAELAFREDLSAAAPIAVLDRSPSIRRHGP
ncbi:MAG: aminoglycoside phosphotransferase family protein [Chloroflexi bacterium]|nr:aminoglycoside phosphotransferase family protein [Chloroflexota bacterium]